MAQNAPGKHYREGMTLFEVVEKFQTESAAEAWFVETRWPGGEIACPHCGSLKIRAIPNRKPQPYRCGDCRKHFSVKTGTVMQGSNLPLRTWAMAYYLMATGIKGTSSMKLHRDLGVTQKTAWHLAHRIRESWNDGAGDAVPMAGPVEIDETFIGGLEGNKHADKKLHAGRGAVGKSIVAGVRDRETNEVRAEVVDSVDKATLQGFVGDHVEPEARKYTDEASGYVGLSNHASCRHSVGRWVDGQAHTNGLESFWALLKRGYHGTYHRMSPKHLHRYVGEFAGRHNQRPRDTVDQMAGMVRRSVRKRLRYRDLAEPTKRSPVAG